jgi:hypothetical protein
MRVLVCNLCRKKLTWIMFNQRGRTADSKYLEIESFSNKMHDVVRRSVGAADFSLFFDHSSFFLRSLFFFFFNLVRCITPRKKKKSDRKKRRVIEKQRKIGRAN